MSLLLDFFADRIIIHTHVPKTAGTTLLQAFYDVFGKERVYDVRGKTPPNASALSESERSNAFVLSGHFWFKSQERWLCRRPVYISMVRNPVERFVSLYRFVVFKASRSHPAYSRMAGKDFAQAVKDDVEAQHPAISNPLCRSFRVRERGDIASLDSRYAIIAPVGRIADVVARLGAVFGHPLEAAHKNVGQGPRIEVDSTIEKLILESNQMDLELCDYVNERIDGWLAELEARLQRS